MAAACRYFEEDAVYRINKKGRLEYGLVLENSEYVSSEDEDEELKNDDWEPMRKGHVRIAWHPRGHEQVLPERKVTLADRALMPGDVVRKVIKGKDTQRGFCRAVDVIASVQVVGTRQIIDNVNSRDLIPLEEFMVDVGVFLDSWVGIIQVVKSKIHLKCTDGSQCILTDDAAYELDDLLDKREKGSEFRKYDFYPGQQLWGSVRCFDDAEWSVQTEEMKSLLEKPNKILRVTVDNVKIHTVGVHWQCRAYSKNCKIGKEFEQPKCMISGDDLKRLKLLKVFEPCTLQLGNRSYYVFKENDQLQSKEEWRRMQRQSKCVCISQGICSSCHQKLSDAENEEACAVEEFVKNLTIKDLEEFEQDEDNCDTISLNSSHSSTSQEKKQKKGSIAFASKILNLRKKKIRKAHKKNSLETMTVKAGDKLVVETLITTSKANVVWQDSTMEEQVASTDLYPIHHLDEQEFFPGDFVIDNRQTGHPHDYGVVKRVDHAARTTIVDWMKTYTYTCQPHPIFVREEEVSAYDLKDHADFKYRPGSSVIRVANFEDESIESSAGQVIDLCPTGKIQVQWVNGKSSFCYPQELYKVGDYDEDDGELWDEACESEDSWETESEQSIIAEDGNEASQIFPLTRSTNTEDQDLLLKPKLAANIERARSALTRVEEIFTLNPALQTNNVMRHLLDVFKHCKFLDRLMETSFFQETHFHGLLERMRERVRINSAQRIAEQVNRFFNDTWSPSFQLSNDETGGEESKTDHVCATLSSLLKCQLLKAHEEVLRRFGVHEKLTEKTPKSSARNELIKLFEVAKQSIEEPTVSVDIEEKIEKFTVLENVPDTHQFKLTMFEPNDTKMFFKAVKKELKLLRSSLPEGILIKSFEDRMDLFSVMITGPARTPYEDGIFFFDFQLSSDYPKSPPLCHYISYCSDRLNPNLYEDGKVCVSLLGTWGGKGTEVWTCNSSLLQVSISIQGLILVGEPYFNEAGYERQKGTQQGRENSRMYNEMVVLKLVQAMTKLVTSPPEIFKQEIICHFQQNAFKMIERLNLWLEISEKHNSTAGLKQEIKEMDLAEFPLLPASKGFCLTLKKSLANFTQALTLIGIVISPK